MQTFIDTKTLKIYSFENDVKVTDTEGIYSFTSAAGKALNVPATLQPYTRPASTSAQLLAEAQAAQNAVLTKACRAVILGGFTSSALGAPYSYPSSPTDQQNLAAAAAAASSAPAGWTTPCWCENAGGTWAFLQHTSTQIQQVNSDCTAMITAARTKLAALKASVASETTVAAVQAITW